MDDLRSLHSRRARCGTAAARARRPSSPVVAVQLPYHAVFLSTTHACHSTSQPLYYLHPDSLKFNLIEFERELSDTEQGL